MRRRDFFKLGAVGSLFSRKIKAGPRIEPSESGSARTSGRTAQPPAFEPEYIVVGSGAGGGTVAARLVEYGYRVLVLEAGGDPHTLKGGNPLSPGGTTLPEDYDVPAFHGVATENDSMKWDFFVRHYADDNQQKLDPKYVESYNNRRVDGIWYPRAGTLGGCTAHSAMILVYPHNSDWNQIADLTGDNSWRAEKMRRYFERLEHCDHRWFERLLHKLGLNPSRHGWSGWLHTEVSDAGSALKDGSLVNAVLQSTKDGLRELGFPDAARIAAMEDPNDWRVVKDSEIGLRYTPLATNGHKRMGSRERLLDVARRYPGRLKIELNALATRVLFRTTRAIGVEYRVGERLYKAAPNASAADGELRQAFASREVILAGGAFNTPQLLMLSGIGPRQTLESKAIPVLVDLPGVGKNLQDRYEVSVVNRMAFSEWKALQGATFLKGDSQYREWADHKSGVYTSNGVILAAVVRSGPGQLDPDLFCFATVADFKGYVPLYSKTLAENLNCLSWVVLKGHTKNTAGEVTLRSADPRDPPVINFHYFNEGTDPAGDDLQAVVNGVKLVRRLSASLKKQRQIESEEFPGDNVQSDDQLREFVKRNAWGHHASCTCPIGPRNAGGVLSSDFKVYGTTGLRVVDASAFPRIPGLFIASAVYMIGEKAADVIADAAR
jgi:choline dehydrogenase-like flavoprotein